MIPLLPCRSIDEQLAFYESIGFEVTYRQKAPNVYASVRRGLIELHFFTMKGYDPATSYSTCYVVVTGIDRLYAEFREGLKSSLGRIPLRGIPRIGPLRDMSYGVRQFLMTDPGGNILRFGQLTEASPETDAPRSRLERALDAAVLLAHSQGDTETAARVLDGALSASEGAAAATVARATILRADVAMASGDDALARRLFDAVEDMELTAAERESPVDDLARLADLRETTSAAD